MDIRYYDKLKFKPNKRFKSIEEEDQYFRNLEKFDFNKAIFETNELYEDLLHVYWSYVCITTICSFLLLVFTLILYLFNVNQLSFFILGLSIATFISSRFIDMKLQRIYRSYMLGKYLLKIETNNGN